MKFMGTMPDESVDMILTDPPYGINYQSNYRTKTEKFKKLCNDDGDMRLLSYETMYRILKNDSVAVIFASWKNAFKDIEVLSRIFDVKNVIVWSKGGGGMGDLKYSLASDYELAIVCHKGKCPIRGKRIGSVWNYEKVPPSKMIHATQKPVELLRALIEKYSDYGDLIFDPYAGSGSTAVAARLSGRDYIACEIDESYYNVMKARIDGRIFT